jgi:hypothetical protein
LPQELALWLIGLGVEMHWIPPGQPQRNGTVERGNGVMQNWADPSQCRTRAKLQDRLDQEGLVQRERYPSISGMPRMEAYPKLKHSGRTYDRTNEDELWELARVDQFLAQAVYHRRTNARGAIYLYGWPYYIGRVHSGKEVFVRFDPSDRHWVIRDHQGQELKRSLAEELTAERVYNLNVGHQRQP